MKNIFCICNMLFFVIVVYSQAPKGPGGTNLYLKGECKEILPHVAYKCTYCEDEAGTKNCKEYNCNLTAECTGIKNTKGADEGCR